MIFGNKVETTVFISSIMHLSKFAIAFRKSEIISHNFLSGVNFLTCFLMFF
jgi:hypothetical protein